MVPGASAIVYVSSYSIWSVRRPAPIILCGAADFLPGREDARIGSDLIRVRATRYPKSYSHGVMAQCAAALCILHLTFLGHSLLGGGASVQQFPKPNLCLNVLDQTKGPRPSCTRSMRSCRM